MVYNSYILLKIKLFILQKQKKELKDLYYNSHTIVLSKGAIFVKNAEFLQKNADISNIKVVLVLKGMFYKFAYRHTCAHVRFKFQVSSIIHTSFRQGSCIPPPHHKWTGQKPIQIMVNIMFSQKINYSFHLFIIHLY